MILRILQSLYSTVLQRILKLGPGTRLSPSEKTQNKTISESIKIWLQKKSVKWDSCGRCKSGCPLIRRLEAWAPAPLAYVLKCPLASHWVCRERLYEKKHVWMCVSVAKYDSTVLWVVDKTGKVLYVMSTWLSLVLSPKITCFHTNYHYYGYMHMEQWLHYFTVGNCIM